MKRVSRQATFLIAALMLAGCSSTTSEPFSSNPAEAVLTADRGQTFELSPGQTARVGTEGLLIGFRAITNDSRCPTDVTCVWAGDAQANIAATIGRMAWTSFALHTNVDPRSATFRNYTITVVGLRPDTHSERPIPAQNYVVTLRVE